MHDIRHVTHVSYRLMTFLPLFYFNHLRVCIAGRENRLYDLIEHSPFSRKCIDAKTNPIVASSIPQKYRSHRLFILLI